MSALPEDRGHFVRWLRQDQQSDATTNVFVARREFAHYLDETLTSEQRAAGPLVRVRQLRAEANGLERSADRWSVTTRGGASQLADAVVIATGLPQVGWSWACPALHESPYFVRNPWAPGALEAVRRDRSGPTDVLLVGTGLTMVDAVLSLSGRGSRPDRRLYAVSRSGRLPRTHTTESSSPIFLTSRTGATTSTRSWAGSPVTLRTCMRSRGTGARRWTG